jgi:hypothetical protein
MRPGVLRLVTLGEGAVVEPGARSMRARALVPSASVSIAKLKVDLTDKVGDGGLLAAPAAPTVEPAEGVRAHARRPATILLVRQLH